MDLYGFMTANPPVWLFLGGYVPNIEVPLGECWMVVFEHVVLKLPTLASHKGWMLLCIGIDKEKSACRRSFPSVSLFACFCFLGVHGGFEVL